MPLDQFRELRVALEHLHGATPTVIEYAGQELATSLGNMRKATTGVLTFNTERIDILIQQVIRSNHYIEAVSFAHVDRSFWPTEGARQYLEAQQIAIADRRVVVTRIFVAERLDVVQEEMDRQRAIGVVTLYLPEAIVLQEERLDFGVFDGVTCYQSGPNLYGIVTEALLYTDSSTISSRRALFARLRSRATLIEAGGHTSGQH